MLSAPTDLQDPQPAAVTAAPARPSAGWRDAWRRGLLTWGASVTAYALLTLFAPLRPLGSFPRVFGFWQGWQRWDAWDYNWYELIANNGYAGLPPDLAAQGPAFYPLYPALISVIDVILPGPTLVAAGLLSAACFLGLLVVFYRLVETELGPQTASHGLWALIAFPAAFFLFAPYNMSLLLLLMVASVYALRRQKWWLAGVLGGLSVLTRPSGLILVLPFAYEYLRQHSFKIRDLRADGLWIGAIPAGLAAYMAYCWAVLGDAFAPSNAQEIWTRQLEVPIMPILHTGHKILKALQLGQVTDETYTNIYDLAAVLFVGTLVVLAFAGPWKFAKDQRVFALTAAGMFLFSLSFPIAHNSHPPLMSAIRYVLEVFPAFIVLAQMLKNGTIERFYLVIGLTLQGFFVVQFLHNDWVA